MSIIPVWEFPDGEFTVIDGLTGPSYHYGPPVEVEPSPEQPPAAGQNEEMGVPDKAE